jgi:hypothetical protein
MCVADFTMLHLWLSGWIQAAVNPLLFSRLRCSPAGMQQPALLLKICVICRTLIASALVQSTALLLWIKAVLAISGDWLSTEQLTKLQHTR